ncbi:hypothetical protein ACIQYQ_02095 [Pseudomonas asiatica]|uniref:hypothetical protein n=1 Tax=Pseudomonas asiatica TaxID=2219225 RepID=UPI00383A2D71
MRGKQKPSLANLVSKTKVATSIGQLYVRDFNRRDMAAVAGASWPDDLEAAGLLVLSRILTRDGDNHDASPLQPDEFERLTQEDITSLVPVAYRHCGAESLDGSESLAGLGKVVKMEADHFTKNTKEMFSRFRTVVTPETVSRYQVSLDGLKSLTDHIHSLPKLGITTQPRSKSWPLGSPLAEPQRQKPVPTLGDIVQPAERSAQASEKSLETLTIMSGELLRMAAAIGDATTSVMQAIPEFMLHLENNKKSASTTMKVTIGGLVFSALVSLGLTGWQVFLAKEAGKSSDKQSAAVLTALRIQLEESRHAQTALSQQLQETQMKNEALNARLITALERMPPPVVKVIQQPVPVAGSHTKGAKAQSKAKPR